MGVNTLWRPYPTTLVSYRVRRFNMPATPISNGTTFDILKTILEGGADFQETFIHKPPNFDISTAIEPREGAGPEQVGVIRFTYTPLRFQSLGVRVKAAISQNGTDGFVVAIRRNLIADPNPDPVNRTFFLRSQDAQDGIVTEFLPTWAKGAADPYFGVGALINFDNNTGQAADIIAGSELEILIDGVISQPEADT